MIYYFILISLAGLAFIDFIQSDKYKDGTKAYKYKPYLYWVVIAGLIIFAGCRYYTGHDYYSYVEVFNRISLGIKVTNMEWGYQQLNYILGFISDNSWIVFFVVSLLTLVIKGVAIQKESKYIFFSLFICFCLYYLIGDMGQIRSTLAQSLDLAAIVLFIKGRKEFNVASLILILLGSLFHISSLCVLVIFIVGARKYKVRTFVITYIVLTILGQFLNMAILGEIGKHVGGFIGDKLYEYTLGKTFAQKVGLSFNVIFDFFMLIFILYMREKYDLASRKFNILFNTYFISICSYVLLNNYFVFAVRFANYFRLSLILLVPMLVSKINNKKIRMFVLMIFIGIFAMMVVRILMANAVFYIPYRINLFGNIIGG